MKPVVALNLFRVFASKNETAITTLEVDWHVIGSIYSIFVLLQWKSIAVFEHKIFHDFTVYKKK